MTDIDWSKAPEWADSVWRGPMTERMYWVDSESGESQRMHDGFVGAVFSSRSWSKVSDRPAPQWSGDGLPPVGLRCEAKFTTDWVPFELLYLGTSFVVFKTSFEVSRPRLDFEQSGVEFRPIRTEAQIAAEEREKAIMEIYKDAKSEWNGGTYLISKPCAEALYQAGYRKQEKPE